MTETELLELRRWSADLISWKETAGYYGDGDGGHIEIID